MHHLDFEKIVDRIGSKYEAVARMSIKARRIADGEMPEANTTNDKVSSMAMNEYLREKQEDGEKPAEEKK
ncbi:DNA-directed RNA polymerase subunit omega [bacterium]|nr:DNA-directed RNA polymerase subunit omega [bacterium]